MILFRFASTTNTIPFLIEAGKHSINFADCLGGLHLFPFLVVAFRPVFISHYVVQQA